MPKYDYLIVGAGLSGAVCAHELKKKDYNCLVVEKRGHIGGNIYTENIEGIEVHKYGAHIFHTSDKEVWNYVCRFAEFNNFVNSPIARYKDECYNLPFNMNTFTKLWRDVFTPAEAAKRIEEERGRDFKENPANLEEQAINLVGKTIYEKLIKGYTEKQWGRTCKDLPAHIIKRLPVRLTFDNNYFNDRYQGIPEEGYTKLIENMLNGTEVKLNCDFLKEKETLLKLAGKIIYTGPVDEYYGFCYGALEYRSLRFETEVLDTPACWKFGDEPYYPVNDKKNGDLYAKYALLAKADKNVIFAGRLAAYKYYDMDDTVRAALDLLKEIPEKN